MRYLRQPSTYVIAAVAILLWSYVGPMALGAFRRPAAGS